MGSFLVYEQSGKTDISLGPIHDQVLPYFPFYDTSKPDEQAILDYSMADNVVGHQQRAFICYWALRAFSESNGVPGIDAGGAGVDTPGCISLDIVGVGEIPPGGSGPHNGVHIKRDVTKLEDFGTDTFSCFISNHLIEHLPCDQTCTLLIEAGKEMKRQEFRKQLGCPGLEVVPYLQEWIRILKPGGYLACIIPDEAAALAGNSSVFFQDMSHQHAWHADQFEEVILKQLRGVKIIQFNSLFNRFSFDFVVQKI